MFSVVLRCVREQGWKTRLLELTAKVFAGEDEDAAKKRAEAEALIEGLDR